MWRLQEFHLCPINGSGSFVHPVTKAKALIQGVLLQPQNEARGFFLGTHPSGRITLEPN